MSNINENKKQMVIRNYFKMECDVDTSVREAYTKGFERGLTKAPVQKWIPCSERLPDKEFAERRENGTVYDLYPCLVTRKALHSVVNPECIYVAKNYYDGEEFVNNENDVVTHDVIAWMPLPEPWKGTDDGRTDKEK